MAIDSDKLKLVLETERKQIVADLDRIGRPKKDDKDWEVKPEDDSTAEFNDEVADRFEEMEEREAEEITLEERLKNIDRALDKIAAGRYGQCEICDQPIELDRLEANPSARTCKKHITEGDYLKP